MSTDLFKVFFNKVCYTLHSVLYTVQLYKQISYTAVFYLVVHISIIQCVVQSSFPNAFLRLFKNLFCISRPTVGAPVDYRWCGLAGEYRGLSKVTYHSDFKVAKT